MSVLNGKTILSGSLGLAAVLAWNDAVKASVDALFPINKRGGAKAMFVYAASVTVLVIIAVAAINRAAHHVSKFRARAKGGEVPPPPHPLQGPVMRLLPSAAPPMESSQPGLL